MNYYPYYQFLRFYRLLVMLSKTDFSRIYEVPPDDIFRSILKVSHLARLTNEKTRHG